MSAAIDDARALLEARLADLGVERRKLENALKELGGEVNRKVRRRGAKGRTPTKSKRRRRGGTRSEHALSYIAKNPGASASDVAEKLKIKPNYLYRVLGDLQKEGKVKKDGRSYTAT